MADVFEVLAQDHAEVRNMLERLERGASTAAGGTDQEMAERKALADRLIIEESKHEALEEMHFWPAVRDRVAHGDSLADTAMGQEDEGKVVLDGLAKADATQPEFELLLAEFIRAARAHMEFEENQVWPALRGVLSPMEAGEMGRRIAEDKKTAPTRPHPRTPASPGVLKAAGPVAAAVDKLRDVMSGRGEAG